MLKNNIRKRLSLEKERERIIARNWLNFHDLSSDEKEIISLYQMNIKYVQLNDEGHLEYVFEDVN